MDEEFQYDVYIYIGLMDSVQPLGMKISGCNLLTDLMVLCKALKPRYMQATILDDSTPERCLRWYYQRQEERKFFT